MQITRAELATEQFCAHEESRYNLEAIFVDEKNTIATNGHVLVFVEHLPKEGDRVSKPIFLSPETARAARAIKKGKISVSDSGDLKIAAKDGQEHRFAPSGDDATKFPKAYAVLPTDNPKAVARVATGYLSKIMEYFEEHGAAQPPQVDIEIFGEDNALRFTGATKEGQKITFLLMPCRR